MKKRIVVNDLKEYKEVYSKFFLLVSLLMFILLFYLFPYYVPHPYIPRVSELAVIIELPDVVINPEIPKPLQRPKIPVEADDPSEIENAIIPTDSSVFRRFGEEDPNVIPPPSTFIPCERYPELIYAPPPEYPAIARAAGIEGKVYLQIFVGKDGKPKKVLVVKSEVTKDCDSAAVKAAWSFKFKPALQRDKPIGVWVSMPIIFKLK